MKKIIFVLASLLTVNIWAQQIGEGLRVSQYDYDKGYLTLTINYTGGCQDHNFSLDLDGVCDAKQETAGRLVDSGWVDTCSTTKGEAKVTFDLRAEGLNCEATVLNLFTTGKHKVRIPLK